MTSDNFRDFVEVLLEVFIQNVVFEIFELKNLSKNQSESKLFSLQEVHPNVGESLCRLWDKVPTFVPKSVPPTVGQGYQVWFH